MKVGIIDYGLGNIKSVIGAIEKNGYNALVCKTNIDLQKVDRFILPGVGAFGDGIKRIKEIKIFNTLKSLVLEKKTPILGICLGAQLLTQSSDEYGFNKGLGWINANVKNIKTNEPNILVPHVGWNNTILKKSHPFLKGIKNNELFYYVHSHKIIAKDKNIVIAECDYGGTFVSIFIKDNIYGTQFHPEKSQNQGLKIIKNFIEIE